MSRPHRLSGWSYRGPARYFLTFCTRNRRRVFADTATVANTIRHFRRAASSDFALLAYCLMPDHAHLLIEGLTGDADLRQFTASAKQRSGMSYARREHTPLWQEGYYERILRPDDDAKAVARYILENPVRAGLVQRAADYPYLGSDCWTVEELLDSVVF
jgi:putative transposase